MRHFDEDFETEAIEKCSRALNRLDDKAKIRVVKYLLDKFGLIAPTDSTQKEVVNQNIQYQQNNLVLAEPKDNNGNQSTTGALLSSFGKSIQMKDVLIKGLTKSEPEVILIVCFINSNFGKESFTRQSILDTLREHKIMSESRRKSLTLSLNSLTKKLYVSSLTDDELMLTELGTEASVNILNGNSTTKKRKPRIKKSKSSNNAQETVVEEYDNDDEQA